MSVVSLAILVCIYHQVYCALLLVIPLTALVSGELIPPEITCPKWVRWLLLSLLLVPALNWGASQYVMSRLEIGSFLWFATGAANGVALSAAFMALAILPFAFAARRSPDQSGS